MALIVHPHFHRRRTGVTRHEEEVVGALDALSETRALGSALEPRVRIGWGSCGAGCARSPSSGTPRALLFAAGVQQLEAEIGNPRGRAAYDREHPQNELLTVQPGPSDRRLEPRQALGLVTAWLEAELGPEVMLPSPDCLALWAPRGVSPELAVALAPFEEPLC